MSLKIVILTSCLALLVHSANGGWWGSSKSETTTTEASPNVTSSDQQTETTNSTEKQETDGGDKQNEVSGGGDKQNYTVAPTNPIVTHEKQVQTVPAVVLGHTEVEHQQFSDFAHQYLFALQHYQHALELQTQQKQHEEQRKFHEEQRKVHHEQQKFHEEQEKFHEQQQKLHEEQQKHEEDELSARLAVSSTESSLNSTSSTEEEVEVLSVNSTSAQQNATEGKRVGDCKPVVYQPEKESPSQTIEVYGGKLAQFVVYERPVAQQSQRLEFQREDDSEDSQSGEVPDLQSSKLLGVVYSAATDVSKIRVSVNGVNYEF